MENKFSDTTHVEKPVKCSVDGDVASGGTGASSSPNSESGATSPPSSPVDNLKLPSSASAVRRRSMTVPIDVAFAPIPPNSSSTSSQDVSPTHPSQDIIAPVGSSSTLPPRKANRFVVSKITEDAIKVGSALIFPPRSTSSSVAGSPEIIRSRSPFVLTDDSMHSPQGDVAVALARPTILPTVSRSASLSYESSLSRGQSKDLSEPVSFQQPVD
jgi:hypothetical protein